MEKKTGMKSFCAWSVIFYCVKLRVKVKFVQRIKRLWSRDQELHIVLQNIKTEIDGLNGRAVSIEVRRRGLIMPVKGFLVLIFLTVTIVGVTKHRISRLELAWFFFLVPHVEYNVVPFHTLRITNTIEQLFLRGLHTLNRSNSLPLAESSGQLPYSEDPADGPNFGSHPSSPDLRYFLLYTFNFFYRYVYQVASSLQIILLD
jgi:hypothetical protein